VWTFVVKNIEHYILGFFYLWEFLFYGIMILLLLMMLMMLMMSKLGNTRDNDLPLPGFFKFLFFFCTQLVVFILFFRVASLKLFIASLTSSTLI
jgi:hypothetical protein